MRSGAFVFGLAGALAMAVLLSAWVPPAAAAVAACETQDIQDATGDVNANIDGVPNTVTNFNRIDIVQLCLTESADATLFVITVNEAIGAGTAQEYVYTLAFAPDNGTAPTCTFTRTSASGTSGSPDCAGEAEGTRLQFTITKALLPLGTGLASFVVSTTGEAPAPGGTGVVTGTDRMPDDGTGDFNYTVGQRAPPGTDTDADGVDDADEIGNGTDPTRTDSDGDGLSDGQERDAGSDPTSIDSDGDGLLDGPGETVPAGDPREANLTNAGIISTEDGGGRRFFGEADFGTDPANEDTDGDGITDGNEVAGGGTYNETFDDRAPAGATDPTNSDTDGDGLTDLEERQGEATLEGESVTFTPTNPNDADTDHDNLLDEEEVRGLHVTPAGSEVRFSPTDPTSRDTDGDGFDDFFEVQQNTNPADAGDKPVSETGPDVTTYLPLSIAFLAALVLVSAAGILWRWG